LLRCCTDPECSFGNVFDVADFIQRNVIAQEIEKVISALRQDLDDNIALKA
jgi:uncharacterized protein YeeX (DUF496 family)